MAEIVRNSVALAGEHAVLSQLMLRGHDAAMTLGNTKGVDILLFMSGKRRIKVEVKTNLEHRNRSNKKGGNTDSKFAGRFVTGWQMKEKHETIKSRDLYYCFVHINKGKGDERHTFRYFIVPSAVVASYLKKVHRRWLKADKKHKSMKRRVFRIGLPGSAKGSVQAPMASKYEDNWNFGSRRSIR